MSSDLPYLRWKFQFSRFLPKPPYLKGGYSVIEGTFLHISVIMICLKNFLNIFKVNIIMSNLIRNINDIYLERIWMRMCYKDLRNSAFSKLIFKVEILIGTPPLFRVGILILIYGVPPLYSCHPFIPGAEVPLFFFCLFGTSYWQTGLKEGSQVEYPTLNKWILTPFHNFQSQYVTKLRSLGAYL